MQLLSGERKNWAMEDHPMEVDRMQLLSKERKNWAMEDHPMEVEMAASLRLAY